MGEPDEHVAGVDGGEDQGVDLASGTGVGIDQESHLGEVDLAFNARFPVVDAYRGLLGPVPALLRGEAVQRPVRNLDALPGEQFVDLDQAQRFLPGGPGHPGGDLFPVGFQGFAGASVPGGPGRADRGDDRPDDLIVHRLGDGVPFQSGRLRGLDVAACRFPVHAGAFGHGPQPRASQPCT